MLRFLFFKAVLPRAGTSSLFDQEVDVGGFTRKDGTYVAPHRAQRRKKLLTTTAATPPHVADLFAPHPAPVQRTLDFGTLPAPVRLEEPTVRPKEPPVGLTSQTAANTAAQASGRTDGQPDGQVEEASSPPAAPAAAPRTWGAPQGTKPAQRKRWNKEALAVLQAKRTNEEITDADRDALARYTGRGGIGDSLNEFYTRPDVAAAMWTMLRNHGFAGGEVLEPSAGTGVFLHTAPPDVHVAAVEMDPVSSRIAAILHPGHEVHTAPLERFATQDGRLFDAVIGNPPFGPRGGTIAFDKPQIGFAENYFLAAALDKVKDGGLVAMIVPTGVMDSPSRHHLRQQLMCQAELVGAHRLPNTAFAEAHTEVTSDIVIFRKRPQAIAGALSALTAEQLQAVGVWDEEFVGGNYITEGRGSGNVLGRMEQGWRAKAGIGNDITVTGSMEGVADALAGWHAPSDERPAPSPDMATIVAALGDDWRAENRVLSAAARPPYQVAHVGDIRTLDGVRYMLQGEPPRWHRLDAEVPSSVKSALAIGEGIEDLLAGRAKDPALARIALIDQLDEFVRDHGLPTVNKEVARWIAQPSLDPDQDADPNERPGAHAERVDAARRRVATVLGAVGKDGTYSDLVTGRTRAGDAADLDTVATQLSLETGGFTAAQLASVTGKPEAAVLDHLFASPSYAVDDTGASWTTLDDYLSGQLWPKYDLALAQATHEGIAPEFRQKYAAQAAALEQAIAPQSLEDVEIGLRSGFLKPEMLAAFINDRNSRLAEQRGHNYGTEPVTVEHEDGVYTLRKAGQAGRLYGDERLIEQYLNRDGTRKDDMPVIARIEEELKAWALRSEYRDAIETTYNRSYRGFRQRAYSDAPMAVPGINPAFDVNRYHFSSIRWALEQGKGIIAADVGLGKTGRGLMLAKIAKANGKAKRPTFVVPKSVVANWTKSADTWFPGCRHLVIGETTTVDHKGRSRTTSDNEATRRAKLQDMRQNDYDFVFITQPAWADIDVAGETRDRYVKDDFWTKRAAKLVAKKAKEKKLSEASMRHAQQAATLQYRDREDTISFDDLGVDMLIMDEAHAYKNLFEPRDRFGKKPKFLGGSGQSKRAQDTQYKTRLLREQNGGKGVYFLTATPTKNSPLEVYAMLSHIAPEAFERMGIRNAEDFIDRFCEFETDIILTTQGKMEEALVTKGFKNLDELREVMRRFIERTTAEEVGLKIPKRDDREHLVEMTAEQQAVYEGLRARAADVQKGDHIFSIMSDMDKAALDLGLLDMKSGPSPKIAACVASVKDALARGKQIVFCDSIEMHDRIVGDLVRAGVPRARIGVINAKVASTGAARQKISDDYNEGKLDVVVGNTATMGEGVNLQVGTTDVHHLNIPWTPADVQQRNGRGLRQGNVNEAVGLHTYLARGSFDGYRYQTLLAKKDWQDLLWNGGDRVENLNQGKMSRDEMMIALAPDPEAARDAFAKDKAAAEQRRTEEARQRAFDMFDRYNQMMGTLKAMRARGEESASRRRLEFKTQDLRRHLEVAEQFPHKDVLSLDGPAIVQPTSGEVWHAGKGFAVNDEATNGYAKQGKWVVEDIDPQAKTVLARRQGEPGTAPIAFDIDDMAHGVAVTDFDAEGEMRDFEASLPAEELRPTSGRWSGAGTVMDYDRIRGLPADVVARHRDHIARHLRSSIGRMKVGGSHFPALDEAGKPTLVPSYQVRGYTAHRLILPDEAGRAHAIAGHDALERSKTIANHYPPVGRNSYQPSRATGLEAKYQWDHNSASRNPWSDAIAKVFGEANRRPMVSEAKQETLRRTHADIAAAATMRGAFENAAPAAKLDTFRADATELWPHATVAALRKRAEELGALGAPMRDQVGFANEKLATVRGTSYAHRTVGEYLDALASGEKRHAA